MQGAFEAKRATQCEGKDTFDTFDQANRIAISTRRKKHKAAITPYRCEYCGKFHIGSNILVHHPKRAMRRVIKR